MYRGGRPEAAPKLRAGQGTSKGELLSVQAARATDLVDWEDRKFPAGEAMGEQRLPEAYHCSEGLLPHMHEDVYDRFPKAAAGEELDDADPPEDSILEELGTRLGKDGERFKNVHSLSMGDRPSLVRLHPAL